MIITSIKPVSTRKLEKLVIELKISPKDSESSFLIFFEKIENNSYRETSTCKLYII